MGGKIESYLYDFYNLKIRGTRVSKWDLNQAKIIAKILSQRGCQVLVLKIPVGDMDFLNKIEDIRRVNLCIRDKAEAIYWATSRQDSTPHENNRLQA